MRRRAVFSSLSVVAVLAAALAVSLGPAAQAQPTSEAFDCNNDLWFVYNEGEGPGSETYAYLTRLVLDGSDITFEPLAGPLDGGRNALGYNPADDFLYALGFDGSDTQPGAGHLYRYGSDGTEVDLGLPDGIDTSLIYTAGTFIAPNLLLVSTGTSFGPATYQVIDVSTPEVVETFVPDTLSRSFDWATNPLDGEVYGMLTPEQQLTTIDVDTKELAPFGAVATDGPPMGSAWFLSTGEMLLFGRPEGGIYQNTLFRADAGVNRSGTGELTVLGSGPAAFDTDGASCVALPTPSTTTTTSTTTTVPSTTTTTVPRTPIPPSVEIPPRFVG